MADGNDCTELKFRIFDGTDIGHGTYSSSITIDMLKQRLLAEWPRDKSVIPKSVNDMKLIHAGRVLEGKTLSESRINIGDLPQGVITMHVVVQPPLAKKKAENQLKSTLRLVSEQIGQKTRCESTRQFLEHALQLRQMPRSTTSRIRSRR